MIDFVEHFDRLDLLL